MKEVANLSEKLTTLEEFMKKYISNQRLAGSADSFDIYKHKNGINYDRTFTKAVKSLYADQKRNSASYGQNYRNISNKGLQNSGYAEYINAISSSKYNSGLDRLKDERGTALTKALGGYTSYLQRYADKQTSLKKSVTSQLINNGIVNLNDAVSYAIGQGLSEEDAIAVGNNAYSVNKRKVFNSILEQSASLGLDKDGAIMLAKKMGFTDDDAAEIGEEVSEMMKHYRDISSEYLEYLEQKSNQITNTFK